MNGSYPEETKVIVNKAVLGFVQEATSNTNSRFSNQENLSKRSFTYLTICAGEINILFVMNSYKLTLDSLYLFRTYIDSDEAIRELFPLLRKAMKVRPNPISKLVDLYTTWPEQLLDN